MNKPNQTRPNQTGSTRIQTFYYCWPLSAKINSDPILYQRIFSSFYCLTFHIFRKLFFQLFDCLNNNPKQNWIEFDQADNIGTFVVPKKKQETSCHNFWIFLIKIRPKKKLGFNPNKCWSILENRI